MKIKIFLITACMALIATYAAAGWLEDFQNVFIDAGIDEAVVEALKQGAVPDDIMDNGLQFEALTPKIL